MKTIATHNGKFHTDDVFAVAALQLTLGEENTKIVRTRDTEKIAQADYAIDVGGEYDVSRNRFDHHQEEGAGERENGMPYASFGLVWREYGENICGSNEVALRIDQEFVQPIDAGDSGVDLSRALFETPREFVINDIVNLFRPSIKETDRNFDEQFQYIVSFARTVLERKIIWTRDAIEAEHVIQKRYNSSEDKRLIIFDEQESFGREVTVGTLGQFSEPLLAVIYRKDFKQWQVVAVNQGPDTYELRKPLPKTWRGLEGEPLQKATGISGAVVCHRAGFMCIAKSKKDAVALAKKALRV